MNKPTFRDMLAPDWEQRKTPVFGLAPGWRWSSSPAIEQGSAPSASNAPTPHADTRTPRQLWEELTRACESASDLARRGEAMAEAQDRETAAYLLAEAMSFVDVAEEAVLRLGFLYGGSIAVQMDLVAGTRERVSAARDRAGV